MRQSITMVSEENDDFMATDIVRTTTGSNFKVKHDGQILGEFHVPAYGRHNILNATAVIGNLYVAVSTWTWLREHLKPSQVLNVVSQKKLSVVLLSSMTLLTIQLKLLQRLMQHVKSTHLKRLLLFSNHIPSHVPCPS